MQDWFAAENVKLAVFKKLMGYDIRGLDAA
jgi:hypothetical protein